MTDLKIFLNILTCVKRIQTNTVLKVFRQFSSVLLCFPPTEFTHANLWSQSINVGLDNSCSEYYRSSHHRCSTTRGVLKNFAKFKEKHLYRSLSFNDVAGLRPATLVKKRLWDRCFPKNSAKFFRTPYLQNTSSRMLM